jgi:hypothetical protein
MWTVRIQGIGYWACLLGFELIVQLILSYDLERRTWLKMTFENLLIVNPLWGIVIRYVKMIGGAFMWQLYVVWFLMLLVIVYVLIGDELLMIAYIHVLVMVRWLLFVWTYAFVVESYVHAFMTDGGGFYIQDWWWRILYPIEVSTMFLLHRRWRPWGVLVPHASREESRTLHAFE